MPEHFTRLCSCIGRVKWTIRRCSALALLIAGTVWALTNKSVDEGPTLLVLAKGYGVTVADLGSVAAFIIAGLLLWLDHGRANSSGASQAP